MRGQRRKYSSPCEETSRRRHRGEGSRSAVNRKRVYVPYSLVQKRSSDPSSNNYYVRSCCFGECGVGIVPPGTGTLWLDMCDVCSNPHNKKGSNIGTTLPQRFDTPVTSSFAHVAFAGSVVRPVVSSQENSTSHDIPPIRQTDLKTGTFLAVCYLGHNRMYARQFESSSCYSSPMSTR